MTLTLKTDGTPVFISTPMGVIVLRREVNEAVQQRHRKVLIDLPPGMKVRYSKEQVLNNNPFLQERDGKIVPKYSHLAVKYNAQGEFTGLEIQEEQPLPKRLTLVG